MKTEVTRAEYLQIVGLLALAEKHATILQEIQLCLEEITGEAHDASGHCADAIYDSDRRDADELLNRLKIKRT